jgi:hypothetical protein
MFTVIDSNILLIIFARHSLNSGFQAPEMGMMILVWLILIAVGVMLCALIGSVIFKMISAGLEAVKFLPVYFAPETSTKSTVTR